VIGGFECESGLGFDFGRHIIRALIHMLKEESKGAGRCSNKKKAWKK
jgi:hypothetical protein